MNLLPIPCLNGFHFLTALFEELTGQRIRFGIKLALTYVGLLGLMVFMPRAVWIDLRWVWQVTVG
jgi:membrane-associated protease RseP (regulator of RpoE activity)